MRIRYMSRPDIDVLRGKLPWILTFSGGSRVRLSQDHEVSNKLHPIFMT